MGLTHGRRSQGRLEKQKRPLNTRLSRTYSHRTPYKVFYLYRFFLILGISIKHLKLRGTCLLMRRCTSQEFGRGGACRNRSRYYSLKFRALHFSVIRYEDCAIAVNKCSCLAGKQFARAGADTAIYCHRNRYREFSRDMVYQPGERRSHQRSRSIHSARNNRIAAGRDCYGNEPGGHH